MFITTYAYYRVLSPSFLLRCLDGYVQLSRSKRFINNVLQPSTFMTEASWSYCFCRVLQRLEIKADRDSEVEKTLDASIREALEEKQNAEEGKSEIRLIRCLTTL